MPVCTAQRPATWIGSPAHKQWELYKRRHPECTLLFRLGDFYEMFGDDALKVSGALGLTLTNRDGVPMCGVPYSQLEQYLRKLLVAGFRVAVCDEQTDNTPEPVVEGPTEEEMQAMDDRVEFLRALPRRDYAIACGSSATQGEHESLAALREGATDEEIRHACRHTWGGTGGGCGGGVYYDYSPGGKLTITVDGNKERLTPMQRLAELRRIFGIPAKGTSNVSCGQLSLF